MELQLEKSYQLPGFRINWRVILFILAVGLVSGYISTRILNNPPAPVELTPEVITEILVQIEGGVYALSTGIVTGAVEKISEDKIKGWVRALELLLAKVKAGGVLTAGQLRLVEKIYNTLLSTKVVFPAIIIDLIDQIMELIHDIITQNALSEQAVNLK